MKVKGHMKVKVRLGTVDEGALYKTSQSVTKTPTKGERLLNCNPRGKWESEITRREAKWTPCKSARLR